LLQGHNGAVHSLAVSANHVVSCGVDRVVRIWTRTAEPLVLEDEREEERAKEEEVALATEAETVVAGQIKMSLPSRKTVGAEKAVS
jgi:U3 small nucleolar RNA-associated protein 12